MHANVPVRFGRGRLDSLGNKGLAAYLIAGAFTLRAEVERTGAENSSTRIHLGVSDRKHARSDSLITLPRVAH